MPVRSGATIVPPDRRAATPSTKSSAGATEAGHIRQLGQAIPGGLRLLPGDSFHRRSFPPGRRLRASAESAVRRRLSRVAVGRGRPQGRALSRMARSTFMGGMDLAFFTGAIVALAGGLVALVALPSRQAAARDGKAAAEPPRRALRPRPGVRQAVRLGSRLRLRRGPRQGQ
jgi:hypothetical protein